MTSTVRAAVRTDGGWLNKVPVITATFWVIKVLSTTIGETFSDYLTVNAGLGPLATDGLVFGVLAAALWWQARARRYTPWVYWLTVVLVSVFGTEVTDFLTDTLNVSLYVSTVLFAVILAVVFSVWYRQEMTLSITSINTPRREAFYWGAILTTFALGTAAGDLATEALSLGFRNGALIFGGLLALTFLIWRLSGWQVLTFWAAYILTRPLGASVGDLLTQDRQYGGLGLGASTTSLLFFAVIVVLVVREQVLVTRCGVSEKGAGPAAGRLRDRLWAACGVTAVVAAGAFLSPAASAQDTSTAAAPASALPTATPRGAKAIAGKPAARVNPPSPAVARGPVSRLGDLSPFSTIVTDVLARTRTGNLAGAATRVKDLEVAWDDAEAGLKPRAPGDWHSIDGRIDDVLTALRADSPVQAGCLTALTALQTTLNRLQGLA
jgi:uncharacterized membrane-anchored protein